MNKSKKMAFQKFYKTNQPTSLPNLEKNMNAWSKKAAIIKVPLKLNTNKFDRKHQCGNLVEQIFKSE